MVLVGLQAITHLIPSAPSLLGLPTGRSRAVMLLLSLLLLAQALVAFQLEAAGQRLPASAGGPSVCMCAHRCCSSHCPCKLLLWLARWGLSAGHLRSDAVVPLLHGQSCVQQLCSHSLGGSTSIYPLKLPGEREKRRRERMGGGGESWRNPA
jgi:hypothetical protein